MSKRQHVERKHILATLKSASLKLDTMLGDWKIQTTWARAIITAESQITPGMPISTALNIVMDLFATANIRLASLNSISSSNVSQIDFKDIVADWIKPLISTQTKEDSLKRSFAQTEDHLRRIHGRLMDKEDEFVTALEKLKRACDTLMRFEKEKRRNRDARKSKRILDVFERKVLGFLGILSSIGIKLPRQTQITEYFKPF